MTRVSRSQASFICYDIGVASKCPLIYRAVVPISRYAIFQSPAPHNAINPHPLPIQLIRLQPNPQASKQRHHLPSRPHASFIGVGDGGEVRAERTEVGEEGCWVRREERVRVGRKGVVKVTCLEWGVFLFAVVRGVVGGGERVRFVGGQEIVVEPATTDGWVREVGKGLVVIVVEPGIERRLFPPPRLINRPLDPLHRRPRVASKRTRRFPNKTGPHDRLKGIHYARQSRRVVVVRGGGKGEMDVLDPPGVPCVFLRVVVPRVRGKAYGE